jgi:hypothetical protein
MFFIWGFGGNRVVGLGGIPAVPGARGEYPGSALKRPEIRKSSLISGVFWRNQAIFEKIEEKSGENTGFSGKMPDMG